VKAEFKSAWSRKRGALAFLTVLLLLAPALGWTGTEAQIKLEQAKVEFSDGRYSEALKLLDEVVAEEPENGEAYHYAGLCMMAQDKPESAVPFLSKAASLISDDAGVHEDLAWARVESGDFEGAIDSANRALGIDGQSEAGSFYKGQGLMGQKKFGDALELFGSVLDSEVFGQAANYYSGMCLLNMGRTQEASGYFEQANKLDPATDLGRKAGDYAASLKEGVEPSTAKPWSARIRLLYQYDTNIVPVHDEDFLPEEVSDMEDGRGVLDLDARYKYYETNVASAYVRYTGYGSWQSEETDLNIMFHRGELGSSFRAAAGDVGLKLASRAYYATNYVDEERYSDNWQASPELTIYWVPEHYTRLVADVAGETFDEPGEDELDRDNSKWMASFYEHFLFNQGKVNTWIGYGYGEVNAEGDNYNRTDHRGHAGVVAMLPRNSQGVLILRFEERVYPDNDFDRHERRYVANASFQTPVYEALNAYCSVVYMNVDANEDALEYERWIYTAGLLANF
jgi:tetratricopeptide (TPR) repeat protein